MNIENINLAIEVLRRVPPTSFSIARHFDSIDGEPTFDELRTHTCGTTACAMGWLALDKRCNKKGLSATKANCNPLGIRYYDGVVDTYANSAACAFFGIDFDTVDALFAYDDSETKNLYGKELDDIKITDVIDKLIELRDTGTLPV